MQAQPGKSFAKLQSTLLKSEYAVEHTTNTRYNYGYNIRSDSKYTPLQKHPERKQGLFIYQIE